ncbi:hypothetical protein GCK32_017912 [Trichostrongylus colubriformis]|uniref:G-protein coupled receptors family 1 profile domain-containing protein n=1 Tax=Trichostrongylus colubriformis TaxID=6319 RepID=A0AAN8F486_TRICO
MTEIFSGVRIAVNKSITERMDNVIAFHKVNAILGAIGCIINLILLFIFLISPTLRRKCEIPIVLCLADCINTFSVMLMGINRVQLYTEIVETLSIPVPTAWECALQPWIIFRGYGALWPPTVQVAMGIDRCVAVFNPIHYNKKLTTWWASCRNSVKSS